MAHIRHHRIRKHAHRAIGAAHSTLVSVRQKFLKPKNSAPQLHQIWNYGGNSHGYMMSLHHRHSQAMTRANLGGGGRHK